MSINDWIIRLEQEEEAYRQAEAARQRAAAAAAVAAAEALVAEYGLGDVFGLSPFRWDGNNRAVFADGRFALRGHHFTVSAMTCFDEGIVQIELRTGGASDTFRIYPAKYGASESVEQVQGRIAGMTRRLVAEAQPA